MPLGAQSWYTEDTLQSDSVSKPWVDSTQRQKLQLLQDLPVTVLPVHTPGVDPEFQGLLLRLHMAQHVRYPGTLLLALTDEIGHPAMITGPIIA